MVQLRDIFQSNIYLNISVMLASPRKMYPSWQICLFDQCYRVFFSVTMKPENGTLTRAVGRNPVMLQITQYKKSLKLGLHK